MEADNTFKTDAWKRLRWDGYSLTAWNMFIESEYIEY